MGGIEVYVISANKYIKQYTNISGKRRDFMPFAFTNGLDIYYEMCGEGQPVILVGGIGSTVKYWDEQVKVLKDRFRVITFDMRGCGKSSVPEARYNISDIADDIAGLMENININRASFIGSGMGGKVIQELALRYPHKVSRMVLANTTAKPNSLARYLLSTWADMAECEIDPVIIRKNILPWVYHQNVLAACYDLMQKTLPALSLRTLAIQCQACAAYDSFDKLHKITAKSLIIGSDKDLLTPLEEADHLFRNISDAHLSFIENAGHNAHLEHPDKFNTLVTAFLEA